MPIPFHNATTEQVVMVTEAVILGQPEATLAYVEDFTQIRRTNSENALNLAIDLKLIIENTSRYYSSHSLAKYLVTKNQQTKAAIIRIILEEYKPFKVFSERLESTEDPNLAATQTKVLLDLDAHRDDIKDTLLSMGTYAQLLNVLGGGRYSVIKKHIHNSIEIVRDIVEDYAACRLKVIELLGENIANTLSAESIISPISDGLVHANKHLSREAIVNIGNGIESYLLWFGNEHGLNLSAFHGINARIDQLSTQGHMPIKYKFIGKYLGHIRNAADHGIDGDIGKSWEFNSESGLEYFSVACSFLSNTFNYLKNNQTFI